MGFILDNLAFAGFTLIFSFTGTRGSVVVEALRYKPEGRGFEIR
jgi:hypothetical protein